MWKVAFILLVCTVCFADDSTGSDSPQMPAGQDALLHYNQACLAARQTFYRTMVDADERQVEELDRAMKIAMNVGNLDEANRIKSLQQDANDTLKHHKQSLLELMNSSAAPGPEAAQTFTVFANQRWTMTVNVHRGERYRITATGQWSGGTDANKKVLICGPDGMVIPDGDHQGNMEWYVEGRVNHKYPFVVGSKCDFVAQEDGPLELEMADWWIYDNNGSVEATVQHLTNSEP
jgi:hypothetical protein